MRAQEARPTPAETILIINELVGRNLLNDVQFRSLHHMGRPIANFEGYCAERKSFHLNGNNHNLAVRLKGMLDSAR